MTRFDYSAKKPCENIVERGENAGNHHFLLFTECFQTLTLSQTSPGFYVSTVQVFFENNVGKGEIARNEQFLLFPHCFQSIWRALWHFHQI